MNATMLLAELEERGVILLAVDENLRVDAPRGAVTGELRSAIVANKAGLMRELRLRPRSPAPDHDISPLVEYAASVLPKIRMTLRETNETKRDFDLLGELRHLIEEYQPGGNHIYLRIVTLDGRTIFVGWRALADRELRMALGRLLARKALERRKSADVDRRFGAGAHDSVALSAYEQLRPRAVP